MEIFDIAVIGAGSAGCALAGRLAARTDLRIALVEAGPDYGPQATAPLFFNSSKKYGEKL